MRTPQGSVVPNSLASAVNAVSDVRNSKRVGLGSNDKLSKLSASTSSLNKEPTSANTSPHASHTSLAPLPPSQSSTQNIPSRALSVKEEIARRNREAQSQHHPEGKGSRNAIGSHGSTQAQGQLHVQRSVTAVPGLQGHGYMGGSSEALAGDRPTTTTSTEESHRLLTTSLRYQKDYETALREAIVTLNSERRVEQKRRKDQEAKWDKLRSNTTPSASQHISQLSLNDLSTPPSEEEITRIMADREKVDAQHNQRRRKVLMGIKANFELKIAYCLKCWKGLEGEFGGEGAKEIAEGEKGEVYKKWVELGVAIKKTTDLLSDALPTAPTPAPTQSHAREDSSYSPYASSESLNSSPESSPESSPSPSPTLGRRCITQENLPTPQPSSTPLTKVAKAGRMSADGLLNDVAGLKKKGKEWGDEGLGGVGESEEMEKGRRGSLAEGRARPEGGAEEGRTVVPLKGEAGDVGRKLRGAEETRSNEQVETSREKQQEKHVNLTPAEPTTPTITDRKVSPIAQDSVMITDSVTRNTAAETSFLPPASTTEGAAAAAVLREGTGWIETEAVVTSSQGPDRGASVVLTETIQAGVVPQAPRSQDQGVKEGVRTKQEEQQEEEDIESSSPPLLDLRKSTFFSVPSVEELIQLATHEESRKRAAASGQQPSPPTTAKGTKPGPLGTQLHDAPQGAKKGLFRSGSMDSLRNVVTGFMNGTNTGTNITPTSRFDTRVAPWREPAPSTTSRFGEKESDAPTKKPTTTTTTTSHVKLFSKSKSRLTDTQKSISKSEASLSSIVPSLPSRRKSKPPNLQDLDTLPSTSSLTSPTSSLPRQQSVKKPLSSDVVLPSSTVAPPQFSLSTSPSIQSLAKFRVERPSVAASSTVIYSASYDDEARLHDLAGAELISIMEEGRFMKASEILPRVRRSKDSTLKKILSRFGGKGGGAKGWNGGRELGSRQELAEGHIFGRSIEGLMTLTSDTHSTTSNIEGKLPAPPFVIKCCEAIQKSAYISPFPPPPSPLHPSLTNSPPLTTAGMSSPGLFRVAGLRSRVAQMKSLVDSGEDIEFDDKSPHEVANLLKAFFREMPEPLLTGRLFKVFLKCGEITDPDLRLRALRLTIALLPRAHQSTLRYLLSFLNDVAQHSEANKMTSSSLAIVIGPNILRPKSVTGKVTKDALVVYNCTVEVVTDLIERWDEVFQVGFS
ncbi:hypothetical protein HDV00_009729 [Rhizophlyctis rosea]|nr:hypothetical protein HDV00_009729 [Rhizophlyctis rosea]